jgi:hypothetical protein
LLNILSLQAAVAVVEIKAAQAAVAVTEPQHFLLLYQPTIHAQSAQAAQVVPPAATTVVKVHHQSLTQLHLLAVVMALVLSLTMLVEMADQVVAQLV